MAGNVVLGTGGYAYAKPVWRAEKMVDNTYRPMFNVIGDRLASAFSFTVQGTSGNTVLNGKIDVLINHSSDCVIHTIGSHYTPFKVKIVSNYDESCTVYVAGQTFNNQLTSVSVEVQSYNGENIDMAPTVFYNSAYVEHIVGPGVTTTSVGTMTAGTGPANGY